MTIISCTNLNVKPRGHFQHTQKTEKDKKAPSVFLSILFTQFFTLASRKW